MNEFQLNFIPNEEDIQIISKILDTNTYLEPLLINSYLDNLSILSAICKYMVEYFTPNFSNI